MKTLTTFILEQLDSDIISYTDAPEIYDIFIEEGVCVNDCGNVKFVEHVDEGRLRRAFGRAKNAVKNAGNKAVNAVKKLHNASQRFDYMDMFK